MQIVVSQFPKGLILLATLGIFTVIVRRLFLRQEKKSYSSKQMLKELLESFDLEIPKELNEPQNIPIKSLENN
mgnify:CR=1 FL=1